MEFNPLDPPKLPPRPAPSPLVQASLINQYIANLSPAPPQSLVSSAVQVSQKSIIEKIRDYTAAARKADAEGKLNKGTQAQWLERVKTTLVPLFGAKSPLISLLASRRTEAAKTAVSQSVFWSWVEEVEHMLSPICTSADSDSFVATSRASLIPKTKKVFIIHGHDEVNWRRLKDLVRDQLNLDPTVILVGAGRTQAIIEKFERHAEECAFAFALFTPDDSVQPIASGEQYTQGRPNVIFETGWFVGRLGKDRVLLLLKKGTRIHSDLDGLNRIEFREDVQEKFLEIKRELVAAGLA